METMPVRHVYRSATERVCAGVCGGLGEYWAIDPVVLRLLWTFITVFTGFAPGIAQTSPRAMRTVRAASSTVFIALSGNAPRTIGRLSGGL